MSKETGIIFIDIASEIKGRVPRNPPVKVVSLLFVILMVFSAFTILNFATQPVNASPPATGDKSFLNTSFSTNYADVQSGSSSSYPVTFGEHGTVKIYSHIKDSNNNQANSSVLNQTINPAAIPASPSVNTSYIHPLSTILTVTISSSVNPADSGQSITFTGSSSFPQGDGYYNFEYKVNGGSGGLISMQNTTSPTWTTSFSPATYIVKVVAYEPSNQGTGSAEMNETVNALPTVSVTASASQIDKGQSVTFSSSVSGGTSPFTYQWYLNGTAVSGATSSTWTTSTLPTGNPTINVSLTDTAGYLVRSNVITETVYPVFSAYISSNKNPSDVYQSITFTASASGGSGTYSSYAFYLSGVLEQNTSSSTWSYEFTTANTYNVSVIVYDSAGEHAVSTWTQTVNPPLQVSISAPRYVIDYGMTITFQSTVTGGTAPYSYQWDLDGQNVSGATSSTYTTSPTLAVGTHTISLWVTDSAGDPEPGKTNSLIPVIITALGLNPYGVPGASDVSNGTVRIGQPFSVRVADIGNIPMAMMGSLAGVNQRPYRFAWYLDGNLIPNATSFIYSTVEFALGVYNFSVRITSLPNETNNRSVFHGIWWGFENVTIVGNVLPPDSVEFIEQGLPVGAWWGAALFTTATYGVALSDDLGAALPVTANGLPTAIITVPTGRYNFSIQYFPKNGYLNYTPELTIGNRTFLSPNNGSRIVGPITLPFATQNGSEIIKVTFVPLNGNVYYSNSSGTQGSISKVSSNVTNSTILPIPTANQQLSDPLYSFAVIGILQTVNKPMANIGVLFIVGIVAIGLVAASLVIQRANRKKQRDKEVDY